MYLVINHSVRERNMSIKLSEANTLKYFWEEKGDFAKYVGYDRLDKKLKEGYPLLFEGLKRMDEGYAMIEYTLDKIIEESEDDLEGE